MAGLYLLHLWWYMLVMLYTKTQTPLVHYVVDLLQIPSVCNMNHGRVE